MELETLKLKLAQAEEAYHQLMIGDKEVSVDIDGFGSVVYNRTKIEKLAQYIESLRIKARRLENRAGRRIALARF